MQTQNAVARSQPYLRRLFTFILFGFCLPLISSCSSEKTIVNGLEEREANEILVFLSGKGITANKVQEPSAGGGGAHIILYDIQVPEEQATEAMAVLNEAGLPRSKGESLLNIFSGTGLVPSDMEQKIRYEAGLGEQIASTIRRIPGIIDAQVLISFPQEDPLHPGKYMGKITASVFVKHNGVLDNPNSHLITKIKRLVAASVTGLSYDDVTVIPVRASQNESPSIIPGAGAEEEKKLVTVWSIIMAQDSVGRFQLIFFVFCAIILILFLILVWMSWKIYPILTRHGGIKELFHLHPIKLEPPPEVKEGEEPHAEDGATPAKPKGAKPEEEHEKDVDIT